MSANTGVSAAGMEPGSPDVARRSRAGIAARRPLQGFCAAVHGDAPETDHPGHVAHAQSAVARARDISEIARRTGERLRVRGVGRTAPPPRDDP
ncbi:MAG: hypothetical protein F4103_08550 [Boseongicola sp. SB0673_bin_14]|nr:hypothetical protein [Boseongicola sp. SB0673_bin_14]